MILGGAAGLRAAEPGAEPARVTAAFEAELEQLVAAPEVTIVHFWASWCSNCKAEHADDGWRRFAEANPDVKVVFISLWGSTEDDRRLLDDYGLTGLGNVVVRRHPNQERRREERVATVLGLPVTWVPTTWVFREGRLRYAINYGEVRFPMLQQMVDDARGKW